MQNLFPLLLRPLRLIFPPQQLRKARIVMLKATHWPFVLAILAYEHGRLWVDDRRRAGSSRVSDRLSQYSPTALRRPLSRKSVSNTRLPRLDDQPRQRRSNAAAHAERSPPPAAPETNEALCSAVANLRVQVEMLSSLLATPNEVPQGL